MLKHGFRLLLILTILTLTLFISLSATDSDTPYITINGEVISFPDQQPVLLNDRTFVPVRFIAESLGSFVEWYEQTKTVTITKDDRTLSLTIGDKDMILTTDEDYIKIEMDVAPIQINDRTLLPLRYIVEAFSTEEHPMQISYDEDTNTVNVEVFENNVIVEYYDNGEYYVGEFDEYGVRSGYGIYYFNNGAIYEGNWKDGETDDLNGIMTWFEDNGDVGDIYIGEWRNGARTGIGSYYFYDGNVYDGNFKDGVISGRGSMVYVNGDVYVGEWKNGDRHGHGIYTWDNGDIFDGNWKNDLRNGSGSYDYADGTEYKGTWKNDVQDGTFTIYYMDGTKEKVKFIDGELQDKSLTVALPEYL